MAKILIIEDNVQNMKLAAFLLNSAGHTVIQANHALGGIAIAQQHLPDLILMDIQLPGMDGLTATRILKGDAATRNIKIYALTALAIPPMNSRSHLPIWALSNPPARPPFW